MKKIILAAMVMATSFGVAAKKDDPVVEESKGITSVSVNVVDWTNSSPGSDFNYLEVEHFKQADWGSFYGFVDAERVDEYKGFRDVKVSAKAAFTINQDWGFNDYIQVFTYAEKQFQVVDAVYGKQFTFAGDNWYASPFLGAQYSIVNNNFAKVHYSGLNGAMFGWNAGYFVTEKVSITNWNEFTFMRDDDYLRVSGDGRDFGINGALAVWYNFTNYAAVGLQWRYADNKLGSTHGSNAVIYTVKATF